MLMWGVFWGAILGALWPGANTGLHLLAGMLVGAGAATTLRGILRTEVEAEVAKRLQAPRPGGEPARAAAPVAVEPRPEAVRAEPGAPLRTGVEESPEVPVTQPLPLPAPAAVRRPAPPPAAPSPIDALVAAARGWLFGGNTVVRVGVLVLFIGLAFLARYAVEHQLLPAELRLAGIAAVGLVLFAIGWRLRHRRESHAGYALTLQGAGVAVLYLAVFAAFRLYHFIPALAAFALLVLVCAFSAVIAVLQRSQPMAFIGFAGGFAAPFLVSTGEGSHVALFSYYTLLGVAIAGVAWFQAWRALNVLGFVATFVLAAAWGVLSYRSEFFASTEPFLVVFFLLYFTTTLLYALRHSARPAVAVDATLVFGVPIAALGLQAALVRDFEYGAAFSALALGAFYIAAGWRMAKRAAGDAQVNRWLAESFAALGIGFVTLAVPLALDGRWTSAVWAVEGAAVYWMAQRQGRPLARAFGIALQFLAAAFYLDGFGTIDSGNWLFANPQFVGATLLAAGALAIAWWSRTSSRGLGISALLFWIGFLWWQFGMQVEMERAWAEASPAHAMRAQLTLANWVASAFVAHWLVLPARAAPWRVAATPAWTVLPAMLCAALWGWVELDHVFQGLGWVAWPAVLAMHAFMLRRLDAGEPQRWWAWVHAGNVWLAMVLVAHLLVHAIDIGHLWGTAWAGVILLVAGALVLLGLAAATALLRARPGWPLDRFARSYVWRAALPVAVVVMLGAVVAGIASDGNARPLPYAPLLNPTDLALGLALGVCALWLVRLRASGLALPGFMQGPVAPAALALAAFIAVNTVWLRVAHHYGGVAWHPAAMSGSFLVQAGYSILWTVLAVVLMVAGHRAALRTPWLVGAGLLGLTLLKLFVVDLSNRGGAERIVVFIAVGVLMLVVGWFAPLPPQEARPADGPAEVPA